MFKENDSVRFKAGVPLPDFGAGQYTSMTKGVIESRAGLHSTLWNVMFDYTHPTHPQKGRALFPINERELEIDD